mmetsp:Transcript_50281/g.106859  ORF Transcript_50281/g.106859 Transcript_50281/m.106859 type:complete len:298 (+) Transcript_50281:80-973(+)|eukprot:CAMPEP_0206472512 /NCGR_PEP_ID=MMETSP0324_2-20121206/32248_1 /ASSEMBLY_ACC=CAM_ASM_000836 /TAXON_ID=2866 /ORGANISM="Crypthecodinium cohnii, Strain Seligo" /LENGTH=297 /DNA_ID=CAMNT_0053947133 /DNA_START=79 /DNA_END=972 /DNA_ORIENTATION=-
MAIAAHMHDQEMHSLSTALQYVEDGSEGSGEESPMGLRKPASGLSAKVARVGVVVGSAMALFGTYLLLSGPSSDSRVVSNNVAHRGAIGLSKSGLAEAQQVMQIASSAAYNGDSKVAAPLENMHDSNVCSDDEEETGGLCYAKCASLTNGVYPYRKSGWECCKKETCNALFGMFTCCKTSPGMCSGFSVAGGREGTKACPHGPGACLSNEELYGGLCYMKCSVLTGDIYPHRVGASACCKTQGIRCMSEVGVEDGLPGMTIMNQTLAVGGGCSDKSDATPCQPHEPLVDLTEGTTTE